MSEKIRSFLPTRSAGTDRKSVDRARRQADGSRPAPASPTLPDRAIVQDASRVPVSLGGAAGSLPDGLRSGMERMSGLSLADVEVHRNSPAPARLGALAYTKGNRIHLAPGQEQHLAHEAWHVVQQKRGRVRATRKIEGEGVNDDAALETEADRMGARAANFSGPAAPPRTEAFTTNVVQRLVTPGELELLDEKEVDALLGTLSYADLRTLAKSLQRRKPVEVAMPAPISISTKGEQAKPSIVPSETGKSPPSPQSQSSVEALKPVAPVSTATKGEQAKPSIVPSETGKSPPSPISQSLVESVKPVAPDTSQDTSAKQTGAKDEPKIVEHRYLGKVQAEISKVEKEMGKQLAAFQKAAGYRRGRTVDTNPFYGNLAVTLYPVEGKNPTESRASANDRVHRPILEVEIVGRQLYARTFLGLYAPDPTGKFKDIRSDDKGNITLKDVGLMNLGNPMKALLWCEDYLSNAEHQKEEGIDPKPVVRSWLIPLAEAQDLLLSQNEFAATRPVDQDRGSGQFSNRGDKAVYDKIMHPLIGSLVSFFQNAEDYKAASDKGQRKFGLVDFQEQLTGKRGDPREFAQGPIPPHDPSKGKHQKEPKGGGMAAQHGRGGYQVKFSKDYEDPLTGYYSSIDTTETGFAPATESKASHLKSRIPSIFDDFPLVKKEAEKLSSSDLSKSGISGEDEQLPEAVNRLRAFARAYLALPAVGAPGQGQAAPGNSGKKPSDKPVPEAPSKAPDSGTSSADKLPPPISQPESAKKVDASPIVPPVKDPSPVKEVVKDAPPLKSDKQDVPSPQPSAPVSDVSKKVDKSERQDARNQYAVAEHAIQIPAAWFQRKANPGGGDCLFHALEQRTLNPQEMLATRAQVAQVRHNMPDTPLGSAYNANVAAATITQSPALWELAPDIVGRQSVPNTVLAMMQSIPTVYAGTEELIQWCRLRNRSALVVDHDGTISSYSPAGHRWSRAYTGSKRDKALLRNIAASGIGLYKSAGHWEHIEGLAAFPQEGAAPVVKKEEK